MEESHDNRKESTGQAQWPQLWSQLLEGLKNENQKIKASPGNLARPCLEIKVKQLEMYLNGRSVPGLSTYYHKRQNNRTYHVSQYRIQTPCGLGWGVLGEYLFYQL